MFDFDNCHSPMERELIERHKREMEKKKIHDLLRELDDFKSCIKTICENYIKMMDIKIGTQDSKVDKAVLYLMENIENVATEVVTKLFYDGKITVDLRYDEENETLYIGGEIIG